MDGFGELGGALQLGVEVDRADPRTPHTHIPMYIQSIAYNREGLLGDGIPADVLDPHLQERARMLLPLLGVNVSAAVFNKILKDLAQLQGYVSTAGGQ